MSLPHRVRIRRKVHPTAWFGPVFGSVVALVAWAGVAHSSGSGWVQAVGALLGAILLVGLVAPVVPARRATLVCTASPPDGQAGRPVQLIVQASGPVRLRPRWPAGPLQYAGGPVRGTRTIQLECTPDRRGVQQEVAVEVASCAPFGLLWWARDLEVALPRPLHVAPRTGTPGEPEVTADDHPGEATPRVPAGLAEPRGIRPYASGDPRRAVHWPVTSHVGSLMVRETERPTDDPVVVEVDLPSDPDAAEAEAERVMAEVGDRLDRHQAVVMVTREQAGRVVRPVRDRVDLGRRLARAVSAPPAEVIVHRHRRRRPA